MNDQKLRQFLYHFHKHLEENNWGYIDPAYFDPEWVGGDDEEANEIHKYLTDALYKAGL